MLAEKPSIHQQRWEIQEIQPYPSSVVFAVWVNSKEVEPRRLGQGELERLSNRHVAPHFTVYDPKDHRQGVGTAMLNRLREYALQNRLSLIYTDDVAYKLLGGRGLLTDHGKLFRDGYLAKISGNHVPR